MDRDRPFDSRTTATANSPGDEELAELSRADPLEFAALYRRYVQSVYGYCLLRLGHRELAEDATSQTFERALAALPRYQSRSFRGWLFRIAHNTVVDVQRTRRTAEFSESVTLEDHRDSPEELAERADEQYRLRRLLSVLSDDQRAIIELELAGVPGPEIAVILGRRSGAVRALRFRAYARLREQLGEGNEL